MPDPYMPDVEVHIAFNAGYTTPAASRTWTDVSAYVELADRIQIAFGRQDERSTAGANTLNLTLDNTDGRFTAGRSASPYYPNVKIGRPIRVRVTPPGGTVSTRFIGFIDEWPVEWEEGTDAYAKAKIRASSRLSRLGLSAKLKSMPEAEITTARPYLFWTLGDPAGSTSAAESSGNLGTSLSLVGDGTAVAFGNAIGSEFDGLAAAEFADGQFLATSTANLPAGSRSYRAAVKVDALPGETGAELVTDGSMTIGLTDAGLVTGGGVTGPNINDGATHDVVLVRDGVNSRLYVDGTLAGSVAAGSVTAASSVSVGIGLTGVMSLVATYGSALSAAQVSAQASAVRTGFAGERTDQRLVRILGWAGVASSEVTVETGVETMTYQQTSGQTVLDALRDVESTESGVLFDGRDGNVTFHNRSHRYLATAVATLNMAAQHVGADYAPRLDRSTLLNDVEVTNPTTDEKARAVSTTSSDEYGVATGSAASVAMSYDPLVQKASWLVTSYAEPRNRVPSLTVDVVAHQGLTPSAQNLLGITVGDLVAVTNAPTQSDTTSPSYFVEGGVETIGPESYGISFNVSPTYPTLSTLVLDSATRGLLDAGILAL